MLCFDILYHSFVLGSPADNNCLPHLADLVTTSYPSPIHLFTLWITNYRFSLALKTFFYSHCSLLLYTLCFLLQPQFFYYFLIHNSMFFDFVNLCFTRTHSSIDEGSFFTLLEHRSLTFPQLSTEFRAALQCVLRLFHRSFSVSIPFYYK